MGFIDWIKKLFSPLKPAKSIHQIEEEAKKEKEKQDFERASQKAENIVAEEFAETILEELPVEEEVTEPEEEDNSDVDETEPNMEEEKKEEFVEEPRYRVWTAEDKEKFATLLRPIVKVYNKEKREEYSKLSGIPEKELKNFKVYGSFEDENSTLTFKFTQSDNYNKRIQDFVVGIIGIQFCNAVTECKEFPDDMSIDLEIEDGKLKIRENLNR